MVIAVHVIMAICAFMAAGMFLASCRGQIGQEMMFGIWIFFGLPAIGCVWALRSWGCINSGFTVGLIAVGLGLLYGRIYKSR